jgi:hypothetical protein
MAKQRKRFYITVRQNNSREIISLRFKPENRIAKNTDIMLITGPYRTLDDASARLGDTWKSLWMTNLCGKSFWQVPGRLPIDVPNF